MRRACNPLGIPAVTRATIARYHRRLADAYDQERFYLVLAAFAARNGRELVRA